MRVLHLVKPVARVEPPWFGRTIADDDSTDAGVAACASVVDHAAGDHSVVVIGGSDAGARARALGLRSFGRIAPALSTASGARRALGKLIRDTGSPDVVQIWGRSALGATQIEELRFSRAFLVDMGTGALSRPGLSASGCGREITTLPPLLAATSRTFKDREAARVRLGADPEDVVIGVLDDPPGSSDAAEVAYTMGILHVAGLRTASVVMRGSRGLMRALRHVRDGGYVRRMIVIDEPVAALLSALDLALALGPSHGRPASFATRCMMSRALASGVPVVSPDLPEHRALYPQEGLTCLARSRDASAMARTCVQLLTDRGYLDGLRRTLLPAPQSGETIVCPIDRVWRSL